MTVTSQRHFRHLAPCLLAMVLVSGCQSLKNIDLNPFSQNSRSDAAPEVVRIEQPSKDNLGGYPVRQPPLDPRDGLQTTDKGGSVTAQHGRSAIKLRPDAPQQYTVVKGDTLWDISGLFLQDPWYWPEIWQVNPQIQNPHLIFPGDVLSLVWVDGQPQILLNRGTSGLDRLSPQIRVHPLEEAIPTIPYDALSSFLTKPAVMSKAEALSLPYVLEIKESHIVAASGFTVYIRGGDMEVGQRYNVMHIGEPLYDPDTRNVLGYQAHFVGTGRVSATGDPAKMFLTETSRETLRGDRLVSQDTNQAQDFIPSAPDVIVNGRIISVLDGVALIGQYQVVVINRGSMHGIRTGNVLSIFQDGETVNDPYADQSMFSKLWKGGERVKIPDEQAGQLMIFRTQEDISYGLVMRATSEIKVYDKVVNPQ